MVDPEAPGADDQDYPGDWFDEALARAKADPSLCVLEELRTGARNPELLDDIENRREELYEAMRQAFSNAPPIHATPETGAALKEYHQKVVIPLMMKLVHQLLGVQAELALHKAQLSSLQS